METRKGLLQKLGILTAVGIGIFLYGKRDIAHRKAERHRLESDSSVDYENEDFEDSSFRRGFPTNNPNLNYEVSGRESRYVGSGVSYSSRTPGDRLSIWNLILLKFSLKDD